MSIMHITFCSCGDIISSYVMSDDAPAYYSAWSMIFPNCGQKILCTWHVWKNWIKVFGIMSFYNIVAHKINVVHTISEFP